MQSRRDKALIGLMAQGVHTNYTVSFTMSFQSQQVIPLSGCITTLDLTDKKEFSNCFNQQVLRTAKTKVHIDSRMHLILTYFQNLIFLTIFYLFIFFSIKIRSCISSIIVQSFSLHERYSSYFLTLIEFST